MANDSNYLSNNLGVAQIIVGQNQTNKLGSNLSASNLEAIDKSSKEFESIFLSQMLGTLFQGIEPDPLFGGGTAENVYHSMLVQQYADTMAQKGDLGIADAVKSELIKLQEVQSHEGNGSN